MGELSDTSRRKLEGVHPDLIKVVELAVTALEFPVIVVEGVRSEARQRELYAQGRTKPGKVVTWTMDSRHRVQKCGYGCAVDLAGVNKLGGIDWNDKAKFHAIGAAMRAAAANRNIPIRWGYDWDGDGKLEEKGEYDGPHFELAKSRYP